MQTMPHGQWPPPSKPATTGKLVLPQKERSVHGRRLKCCVRRSMRMVIGTTETGMGLVSCHPFLFLLRNFPFRVGLLGQNFV